METEVNEHILYLIEKMETKESIILVFEFIIGIDLFKLRTIREDLTTLEARLVVCSVIKAFNSIQNRDQSDRELHIENMMLRIKTSKLTNYDLKYPKKFNL